MIRLYKRLICISLLLSASAFARIVPYISIRSQGENAARELVLWQTEINRSCMEKFYGSFSITPEFTRSMEPKQLAKALFCDAINTDCCDSRCATFAVQGSQVSGRNQHALLADLFGLPTDYESTISVEPRIENFLIDFNIYLGLDNWYEGLYFRIHAPLVHTRWNLNFCETVGEIGNNNHPLGYFNGENVAPTGEYYGATRQSLVQTFEDFVSHRAYPSIDGVVFDPLDHARMSRDTLSETSVAELTAAFGWNFLLDSCYHFGLNLRAAAPTGTRPEGIWLFEPVVGNSKHWELGAGLTTHYCFWTNDKETSSAAIYLDANATHLFKARQCRTFDLTCKPLGRYALAQKMTSTVTNLQDVNGTVPTYQFAGEFNPVANLTTIKVDVNAALQADIAVKFAFTHCNFQFDIGYECWARSCEHITPRYDSTGAENTSWALKGDAFVYGFTVANNAIAGAIPLSATESDSSIFCGTNNAARTDIYWSLNPGVDNAKLAYDSNGTNIVNNTTGSTFTNMYSSFGPQGVSQSVFTRNDTGHLDITGAQAKGISHKLFGNWGYIWKNRPGKFKPYLGLGTEVEFGKIDTGCYCYAATACPIKYPVDQQQPTITACSCNNCTQTNCCTNVAISQWGIWIKGGFSF